MRLVNHLIVGLSVVIGLAGCDLFASQAITPPPPPAAALQTTVVVPTQSATAGPGEIIYTRDGQIRVIGATGANDRALIALPAGSAIRELTLSPNGRYLAYSLNSLSAVVLDLSSGQFSTVDESQTGNIASFVWSGDSAILFYHRLGLDAASYVPTSSQLWRVTMPPTNASQKVFESDIATSPISRPVVVLGGKLILNQTSPASNPLGDPVFFDLASGQMTPLGVNQGVWDVSPDLSKILLFSEGDITSGQITVPVPLYQAALSAEGPVNVIGITPDEGVAYWKARFAPDGVRIVSLRYVKTETGFHAESVLLTPAGEGEAFHVTVLGSDPAAEDVAFSWHGEDGVVVQRLRNGIAELWLLPLDGSAGRFLGTGEQPVVIGGR
jgi:WD40 repeat protein